ncbi:MAG: glycosyltransferase family 1 protein [Candidatus Pacebacteria bacterium]|nr:glycosyltransferase family 1 protein [Candidatus Paceibacterota bacterium]
MNKSLVVIPSAFTEVTTDYIHQTALLLSKKHCVLVLDLTKCQKESFLKRLIQNKSLGVPIKKIGENYYQSFPLAFLPLVRFKLIQTINKHLDFIISYFYLWQKGEINFFSKKVLWIFHPWGYKQISHLLKFFPTSLLDIVDWFRISADERIFLSKVSYVFVNSHVLEKKIKKYRPDCKLVPQGFDLETFKKPVRKIKLFENNSPVVGYVGGISKRLDYDLLYKLVSKSPQWNFVLWGPIFDLKKKQRKILDEILRFENVAHGSSEKKEIPSIIGSFDIGMIPYNSSQRFNQNCFPMKIFEYFYLEKPVLSTLVKELKRYKQLIKISDSATKWKALGTELLEPHNSNARELAIRNSWSMKVSAIINYL